MELFHNDIIDFFSLYPYVLYHIFSSRFLEDPERLCLIAITVALYLSHKSGTPHEVLEELYLTKFGFY